MIPGTVIHKLLPFYITVYLLECELDLEFLFLRYVKLN